MRATRVETASVVVSSRGSRRRAGQVHARAAAGVPREGAPRPRRVRTHARQERVRVRPTHDRSRDRAQPRQRGPRAQARQQDGARADRRRGLPDRARALQHRAQRPPPPAAGRLGHRARAAAARVPQPGLGQGRRGPRRHRRHRHPADGHAGALRGRLDQREHPLRRAQQRRARRPRRGRLARARGPDGGAHRPLLRQPGPRVGVHLDPAAPAGPARALRRPLERRPGPRRPAARARGQLAVLPRAAAVGRDPHPALHPGHRHALGRAEEPGRAARASGSASGGSPRSSTSSRRTSATSRRCCPSSTTRSPRRSSSAARCPSSRSCACTTARSTAGTARSTTSSAAGRTCASRTASCRPARASPTSWPTPPSTTAPCASSPRRTARSGPG